jgi:hypothetical protein
MSDEDANAVAQRLNRDDLTVKAYRFEGDPFCKAARFDTYARKFGKHFDASVLPDSAANPETSPFFAKHIRSPHSVVTQHLINLAGEPTLAARDDILEYLRKSLA